AGQTTVPAAGRAGHAGEVRGMERLVVEVLGAHSGRAQDEIDRRERLSRLIADSLGAAGFIAELGRRLGRELSPTLFWEHPSAELLARYLASGEHATEHRTGHTWGPGDTAIAVVGLACRFPGAASAAELWDLLVHGRDAIRDIPADRWPVADYLDPDVS